MKRFPVEITVLDYNLEPLPKARVTLTARASQQSVTLDYDQKARAFVAKHLDPGPYDASVEATALAVEKRDVDVTADGLRDRFILGREGMPAYYRGRVRVPFEPTELVAASLRPQRKTLWPEGFDSFASALKLERANVSPQVAGDFVAVFHLPKDAGEEERAAILGRLQNHEAVRHAGPVVAMIHDSVSFLTNELIVRFKDHVEEQEAAAIARKFDAAVVRTIPYAGNAYLFRTATENDYRVLQICEELVATGRVVYAEPNLVTTAVNDFHPNDTLLAQQTHHPIIGSETAWDTTLGTNSVIVAVMDTGCDISHPDFQNAAMLGWTKLYSPFDFVDMDFDPTPGDPHGTKSCGIAAANANNTTGVAGLASGCKLLPMRRPSGFGGLAYADAYIWAAGFDPLSTTPGFPARIAPGADVISSSFGFSEAALPGVMKDCFDYLTTYGRNGKGCVVVFSSGNDNLDFTTYRQWAAYEKTIAVASSTLTPPDAGSEHKASSSNFGSKLDLCAPGGGPGIPGESRSLSSTNVGTGSVASGGNFDYDSFGQTSCACPQVSGTAALMLSAQPALTWVEVRQILRDTATKIDFANADPIGQYTDSDGDGIADYSQWYGFGRLNAGAAVPGAAAYTFPRDIIVRDNLADTGSVATSSPWWASPDIWVRTADPAGDAAALPASYASSPPHQDALANHDHNWVYVRYKNGGTQPSYDFYIRVYLMHWPGLEFRYPDDFIPTTRPSDPLPSPLVPGTYLIGEVRRSGVAAGTDDHVAIHWPQAMIPPESVMVMGSPVHWHPCLLVEITPHDGPSPTGVHVWDDNNLAQRNVTINYVDDDDISATIVAGHRARKQPNLSIVVDRNRLSASVELTLTVADERVMASLAALVARGTDVTKGLSLSTSAQQPLIVLDRAMRTVRVPLPGAAGYVPIVIRGRRKRGVALKPALITVTQYDGTRPTGAAAVEIGGKRG